MEKERKRDPQWGLFCFVDWMYTRKNPNTGKSYNSGWKRIEERYLEAESKIKGSNLNVFASVQRWKDPIPEEGQSHYAPVYFDLDVDPVKEPNLDSAIRDAKKLWEYFNTLGVSNPHTRIWFSGSKGFHLTVEPEVFGIKASVNLTYIMKRLCQDIQNLLELKTLDLAVYSKRRVLRVVNSIHQTSNLFKVEITVNDLNQGIEHIRALAVKPQEEQWDPEEYKEISPVTECVELYKQAIDDYETAENMRRLEPHKPININTGEDPVCVKDLITNSIRRDSVRNQAQMVLASYYKDIGVASEDATQTIIEWVEQVPACFTSTTDPRKLRANVISTVKTVYENKESSGVDVDENPIPKYHFTCAFIRTLGSKENPIRCDYDKCRVTNEEDQETKEAIHLPLYEATKACYSGSRISMDVTISGKCNEPFIVPEVVLVTCNVSDEKFSRENSKCKHCSVGAEEKEVTGWRRKEFRFNPQNSDLIEMLNVPNSTVIATMKQRASLPKKCPHYKISIKSKFNVTEVTLIPSVDFKPDEITDCKQRTGDYVVRKAFYLGHDIEHNKDYKIEAYPHPHPKTQSAVFIFSEKKESKTTTEYFEMTDKIFQNLKKFRGDPKVMMPKIHKDFANNVHHIWDREDVGIATDLVYHSVLRFNLGSEVLQRGWTELLLIGDSGQAKTTLIERLMNHYKLGQIISGEVAKRTGLIYNIQNNGGSFFLTWGAVPLNDGRILVIDEAGGLEQADIEKMSRLRTTGVAEVMQVIQAKTYARTRLIFIANPKSGSLSDYHFGVESIKELIGKKEDIRRFDFALGVKTGDIDSERMNRVYSSDDKPVFDSISCRNLILWAWSRKPDQVYFQPDAANHVMKAANLLSEEFVAEIPLVEPADQRLKVARLSVALAARLFSSDKKGDTIIVCKEHVEYISKFLFRIYTQAALEYGYFSLMWKKKNLLSDVQMVEIRNEIRNRFPDYEEFIELMLSTKRFRKGNFLESWGHKGEKGNKCFSYLVRHQLIEETGQGMAKTNKFTSVLKEMYRESMEMKPRFD